MCSSSQSKKLSKSCNLSLPLLFFLFLPSLLAAFIIFLFFSLFLFLPFACVLAATLFLPAIIGRVPVGSIGRVFVRIGASAICGVCSRSEGGVDLGGVPPECIGFDRSEVPSFGESDEEDESIRITAGKNSEGMEEDVTDFDALVTTGSGEYKTFYEILSYWRRRERESEVHKRMCSSYIKGKKTVPRHQKFCNRSYI